ncbi:acyl-CoA dehydrogenase family protein [Nocardioides daejeonensis]|uniref:acyl-CoA dehydrogenase family protein n=1 Tax=Nocardioides daejeonensis TaxID=1046556 RepID=UPI001EF43AFC|nr:acyl-CoA dehydrogenase family protein [Nocardioides daejeonensis]
MTTALPLRGPDPRPPEPPHRRSDESDRLAEARQRLDPVFERIAAGTVDRERAGQLPRRQVVWLKEAGFGALRVPREYGGAGLDLVELSRVWIDLAAVDANLAQAFRGHFAYVEDRLHRQRHGQDQRHWWRRFVAGEMVGNAWADGPDGPGARLVRGADGLRLTGRKSYTTGSIFAEWMDVQARDLKGEVVQVIASTAHPGVRVSDDWQGFGQRGTGSGTAVLTDVPVDPEHIAPLAERPPHQSALFQLNLLATLVGIGRAALRDTVLQVRRRHRNFSHANAAWVRDDPQVLGLVGELAAAIGASEAITLRAAEAVDRAASVAAADLDAQRRLEEAEIATSTAQVAASELVLRATSDLFDTLGASATTSALDLDRHWRNARTVASHNPRILKARVVGAHLVNATPPPYAWTVGTTSRQTGTVAR